MERYLVIGLGAFGAPIARRLGERGQDVLAVDSDERLVEEIKDHVARSVVADASDRDSLEALGAKDFTTAVVAIGSNLEASVIVTAVLREMGIPRIVARATSPIHSRILSAVGADTVVSPETDFGIQLADNLVSTFSMERIPLAEGILLVEMPCHPGMHGKTLRDLDLRKKYGVYVVGIETRRKIQDAQGRQREKTEMTALPHPDHLLREGEVLVIIGSDEGMKALSEAYGR